MTESEKSSASENTDVICSSILAALSQIEKLISDPNNQTVFELQVDASTTQAFRELSSLQLSLGQYATRNQSLNYYGFIGHFSAGKTTTINSLLESDDPRPTGHHPTDTSITMIAHENNVASLIGTHRRGELAVGTSLRDDDLLLNTVIVDTPGSGDPTIVEEMVRDFLPICDTLIYVLSATAPLDNSDVPTLKKAIDELPFIPVKFVVTRADEFRDDTQQVFSSDNYDAEKANNFRTELSRRLQSTIQGLSVSPEDIILIDNVSRYNVDFLKEVIFSGERMDAEQSVKLHTHKLSYFAKSADHIRTVFVNHVKSKIDALHSFLDDAKANHDKFRNVETMASSNLTESWQNSRNSLDQRQISETESISDLDICNELPNDIRNAAYLQTFIQESKQSINDFSERTAQDICRRTKKIFIREHDHRIEQLRHEFIKMDDSDYPVFSSLPISGLAQNELFDLDITFQRSLTYQIEELPNEADTLINKSINTLLNSSKRLKDRLSSEVAISTSRETINQSIEQLRLMLEEFFKSVQVYRSAILAMNARSTAQEAGIVDTIENLEQTEITPTQRAQWLDNITGQIFPNWNITLSEFDASTIRLKADLNTIRKNIKDIRQKAYQSELVIHDDDMPSMKWIQSNPQVTAELESFVVEYNSESSRLFSILNKQQTENLSIERAKAITDKKAIRATQKAKIRRFFLLPVFLVFVATLLYFLSAQQQPTNWATPLITNFASWIILGLMTMVWDKTKEEIKEREQQYHRTAVEVANDLLNQESTKLNFHFIDAKQEAIKNIVYQQLNSSLDSLIAKYVVKPFTEKYEDIREISRKLDELNSKYLEAVKTLTMSLNEYYSNTRVNLSALDEVSTAIRAEAIEPSFDMLQDRDNKLNEVHQSLVDLDIMMRQM